MQLGQNKKRFVNKMKFDYIDHFIFLNDFK